MKKSGSLHINASMFYNEYKEQMYKNTSRKNYLYLLTPAETAILQAIDAVERVGADPRLTDAINLLSLANDKVAEYVDTELFGLKKD